MAVHTFGDYIGRLPKQQRVSIVHRALRNARARGGTALEDCFHYLNDSEKEVVIVIVLADFQGSSIEFSEFINYLSAWLMKNPITDEEVEQYSKHDFPQGKAPVTSTPQR